MIKKGKKYCSFLAKSVFIAGILAISSLNISYAGHKNYFIRTSVDYSGFGLLYEIITDDGNGGGDTSKEYEEEKNGYNYSEVKHYGKICLDNSYNNGEKTNYLYINFNDDRSTPAKREAQYEKLQTTSDDGLVFSFPGLKGEHNGGYKATSNDYSRASKVGDTLVTGLNQALLFIRNNANQDLVSNHSLHLALAKLSYTSELNRMGGKGYDILVGSGSSTTSFNIVRADYVDNVSEYLIPVNGLDYSDYVRISTTNGKNGSTFSFFPWKMGKGYYEGQELYEYVNSTYRKNTKKYENEYLTWGQLILQAMLNNDTKGTQEQDFASDVQTIIGQGLGSDLSRTISSTRSLLGLSSMSELVLNMGSRPANYHLGVMSTGMHNIALTVYTLNLIISLLFVGFMIIKMIHQKMIATTNVIAKTSLMEGIKDLIFVAVMLGFFAPLFEMLLELNFLIVRTFSYSSEYMASFSAMGIKVLSMESIAGFIVSTMFLSIDVYINFVYLVRAITVSFLFAIAPIMIVSYLWSPTQKNMVFGYFRELVGNIFMQSFHAITMTFFSAYNLSNMSSLEAIASAYCFIPITQLFRQLVIGNSGGFSEKIGGKLAGQVSTMATGLRSSALTAKQTKEMVEAQTKATKDTAIWNTVGQTAGGAISALGAFGGVPGMLAGGALGSMVSGAISGMGTVEAQKELGKVQSKQADEKLGMGLMELGMGLGVSSYDGAGDRMIGSGLSTIKEGALIKGQADARFDPDAFGGYGKASINLGVAETFRSGGMVASQAIQGVGKKIKPNDNTIMTGNSISGIDSLDINDIKHITNKNEVTNTFDVITKFNANDLALKQPKLYNALEDYRDRHVDPDRWAKTSKNTGIEKFFVDKSGFVGMRMDSDKSGYIGYDSAQQFNEISSRMENIITSLKFENKENK